ncbi:MAG TPA: hypothetical protein VM434_16035 [Beijerinckiaceae bacterium]|nr:hypothetical protein [Beijerinckiaceae bacterium]
MTEILLESAEVDLCTVRIGDNVVITNVSRREAEAIAAAFDRLSQRA